MLNSLRTTFFAMAFSTVVKLLWTKYFEQRVLASSKADRYHYAPQPQPYMDHHERDVRDERPPIREEREPRSSGFPKHMGEGDLSTGTLCWLIAAPFFCMMLTPYMINIAEKLYTGNFKSNFYLRQTTYWYSGETIYQSGFEICPSDFLVLEGEYYFAVPIWYISVLFYLAFWLNLKRNTNSFKNYNIEQKVRLSMVLLFSASIVGVLVIFLTFLTGIVGKIFMYLVGNVEMKLISMDSSHFHIGFATMFGTIIVLILLSQFFDNNVSPHNGNAREKIKVN